LINWFTSFDFECAFLHDTSRFVPDAVTEFARFVRI
jgi:hypothetical protein